MERGRGMLKHNSWGAQTCRMATVDLMAAGQQLEGTMSVMVQDKKEHRMDIVQVVGTIP